MRGGAGPGVAGSGRRHEGLRVPADPARCRRSGPRRFPAARCTGASRRESAAPTEMGGVPGPQPLLLRRPVDAGGAQRSLRPHARSHPGHQRSVLRFRVSPRSPQRRFASVGRRCPLCGARHRVRPSRSARELPGPGGGKRGGGGSAELGVLSVPVVRGMRGAGQPSSVLSPPEAEENERSFPSPLWAKLVPCLIPA